jgi:hypothetical protein
MGTEHPGCLKVHGSFAHKAVVVPALHLIRAPTMAKNSITSAHAAFFQKYAALLEECLTLRATQLRSVSSCRKIVQAAREELSYSTKTSSVDILSPLRRSYKVWKAHRSQE